MKTTTPEAASKERDPYAWIVLRLPKKHWIKGQIIVEKLKNTFRWNIIDGAMKFDDKNKSNKNLQNSNIVQIVHHALDASTPEPQGYATVFPYLLKGSTLPISHRPSKEKNKKQKKRGKNVTKTKPFVKDKMLWQVL